MEEMNPLVGVRLSQPNELSLHCLAGMLGHVSHDEEPFVRHGGSGAMVIRTIIAACPGVAINGLVPHIGHKSVLAWRQQRHAFGCREAGHRASTPGTLADFLVAWHQHLPSSIPR